MLLQTVVVVPLCCANGSIISAHILLDSAGQRTNKFERLAKHLPSKSNQFLHLDLKVLKPLIYTLFILLSLSKSSHIGLHANILNQINSPIQRGPLQSD